MADVTKDRIEYGGRWKTSFEWLKQMGYDYEPIRRYANRHKLNMLDVVRLLLRHVYANEPIGRELSMIHRYPKDLREQRFGRLTAISDNRDGSWHCMCECGNETDVKREYLITDQTRSCGCLRKETQTSYYNSRKNIGYDECLMLTFNGKTLTVSQWAEQPEIIRLGIKRRNIYSRLKYRKWSVEKTLSMPCVRKK